jgi:hypothetical protein
MVAKSFRVPREFQLQVESIRFQSPGLIVLAAAAIPSVLGSIWVLMQILEKASVWRYQGGR